MSPVDGSDHGGGFLARWSRRKRVAAEDTLAPIATEAVEGQSTLSAIEPDEPVDLTLLPDIETLTAESDIAAFLVKGVPDALKNAALRKIWVSDPAIRDFIGPVDYQWDFNKPDFMHGFGELDPGMDVQHMVRSIFGEQLAQPGPGGDVLDAGLPQSGQPDSIGSGDVSQSAHGGEPASSALVEGGAAADADGVQLQDDHEKTSDLPQGSALVGDFGDDGAEIPAAPQKVRRHGSALPR
ncbi:Protein of unknown function DUF3306 [Rhabdaerophilaceae bacterium]